MVSPRGRGHPVEAGRYGVGSEGSSSKTTQCDTLGTRQLRHSR